MKVSRMAARRRPAARVPAMSARLVRTAVGAALGLALVAGPALLAAGPGAAAPAAAASSSTSGSTLRIQAQTAFSTFNPFTAYFDGDLEVIDNIYPLLTAINKTGQAVPYLATKWSISADKLSWTLTIKSGLKWSDGKPITAADAAWTLNLIMHNSVAATANGALVADFKTVTAPNATTLVITTSQPEANILYNLNQIPIVPQHVWASEVSKLNSFKNQSTPVVGYGPWQLTGYAVNQYATLTANSGFFLGAPHYHTLIIQYFSNSDAMVSALRSGQLDAIEYNLTAPQFNSLKGVKGITVYPQVSSAWTAVELNPGAQTQSGKHFGNGNPALTDPRVRQAIEMALNKQELVSKIWDGLAVTGAGYLTPAYPQYVWKPPASESLAYNPAKANALLTSAGYKMGPNGIRIDPKTHKPLNLRLGIHSDEASDAAMAPYIVEWLKAIGIGVTVDSMSFNQLNTELPEGNWDMLSDTWSTGPDPTFLLSIQTCGDLPTSLSQPGNTDSFFCNKTFDQLYNQQGSEFNQAQRVQTINQMQQILYQNAVDVILYYPDFLSAVRTKDVSNYFYGKPNAQGFYPSPSEFINWRSATPVAGASSSSSSGPVWIVVAVVVVALLAGAFIFLRRRSTAGERE
jgi:peptide/nickel transport system substrate-binding protein